ncbi:MAG: DegV family protein [Defluviitaleaceae bacterium]|nr:DegV family protein [Defluviitaleaceae bacterium]
MMAEYVLSCETTADMPASFFKERGIPYSCFHFTMDGAEYPDDIGETMSYEEFYKRVAGGALPTTSQINAEQYTEMFEKSLREGKDVIHVCLSSGISNTLNSALISKEELAQKYPERKIYIVDSYGASSGFGLLMEMAADKRDSGFSVDELHEWLEENKTCIQHWFFTSDLSHLKRGGRISTTAAVFGTLLNICPLLSVNFDGHLVARKKIRGRKQVILEMVRIMAERAENGAAYSGKCIISNSACPDDAKALADQIELKFPNLKGKIMINPIGAVIGSHTGPGTVALFYYGDKRID